MAQFPAYRVKAYILTQNIHNKNTETVPLDHNKHLCTLYKPVCITRWNLWRSKKWSGIKRYYILLKNSELKSHPKDLHYIRKKLLKALATFLDTIILRLLLDFKYKNR